MLTEYSQCAIFGNIKTSKSKKYLKLSKTSFFTTLGAGLNGWTEQTYLPADIARFLKSRQLHELSAMDVLPYGVS